MVSVGQDSRLGLDADLCPSRGGGQDMGWGCCLLEARLGQGLLPCSLTRHRHHLSLVTGGWRRQFLST